MSKYDAFAMTFRPRGGIKDEDVELISNNVMQRFPYYYVITEKENEERHVHAGVFGNSQTLSHFNQIWSRLLKRKWSEEGSLWRYAYKSSLIYDDKWTEYMQKGDKTVIIEKNIPDKPEKYYASAKEKKERKKNVFISKMAKEIYDDKYERKNKGNNVWCGAVNLKDVSHYLQKQMVTDQIDYVQDDRKFVRLCYAIFNKIRGGEVRRFYDKFCYDQLIDNSPQVEPEYPVYINEF